jgi:hypothetical protein
MDYRQRDLPVHGAFAREDKRAKQYKKLYADFVKMLFNLPVHPGTDNLIYEWQIAYHDVYAVNADDQKDGILISMHPLNGIMKVQAYQAGELLCNIDTSYLLQLVCP